MRLTPTEQDSIRAASRAVLPPGTRVSLFGSRTDDSRKGGDIDLLIEPAAPVPPDAIVAMRTRLGARLYRLLGERRIDIVVAAGDVDKRLIVTEARKQGIELVRT